MKWKHHTREDIDRAFNIADKLGVHHTSQRRLAQAALVSEQLAYEVLAIMRSGTEDEKAEARSPKIHSLRKLSLNIRNRNRDRSPHSRALGAGRSINNAVFQQVKEVLDLLLSMPAASDVAEATQSPNRMAFIKAKLPKALQWLQEYNKALENYHVESCGCDPVPATGEPEDHNDRPAGGDSPPRG